MPHASSIKFAALVLFAILSVGCNKNPDETRTNTTAAADGAVITNFSTLDAQAWVNGSPVSLDEARGKHVVLIEAWHPT